MVEGTKRRLEEILHAARHYETSDIHLLVNLPPVYRINGEIILSNDRPLTAEDLQSIIDSSITDEQKKKLAKTLQLCYSITHPEFGRFRTSIYYRNSLPEFAIRMCNNHVANREELGLPLAVEQLVDKPSGIILITGATGSGKTTTLNYMIDYINSSRNCKIITIEDPIEYVHQHKRAIIVQQELHTDVLTFSDGLHHILRQDPDVIAIGEMRNFDTIETALTAAETGHLVIATLHTSSAMQTVERIIGVFPPSQQQQIILQLANSLQGILTQQLVPTIDKKQRKLAYEFLAVTPAVRNIIRSNDSHHLNTIIETNRKLGMVKMDNSLCNLYENGDISYDALLSRCLNLDVIKEKYNKKGV